MKKKTTFSLIQLLLIITLIITLASCQQNLESEAKKQLKTTMKELLKDPDSATLTNVQTAYSSDSVCVIYFDCKAKNGFGGYSSSYMEYLYCIDKEKSNGERIELVSSIGDDGDFKRSVMEKAEHDYQREMRWLSEEQKKNWKDIFVDIRARMRCEEHGRVVDDTSKGSDIKL